MITVLRCLHCGSDSREIGTASASINISVYRSCNSCNHGHETKDSLYFCSMPCLVAYVQEHPDALVKQAHELERR